MSLVSQSHYEKGGRRPHRFVNTVKLGIRLDEALHQIRTLVIVETSQAACLQVVEKVGIIVVPDAESNLVHVCARLPVDEGLSKNWAVEKIVGSTRLDHEIFE